METQLSFLSETPSLARGDAIASRRANVVPEVVTIFIDGAARGNPGPAGAGIVIIYDDKPVLKEGFYLGEKTNNQAEYTALVLGIILAQKFCDKHHINPAHFEFFSDSELLVKQLKGHYKIKNTALAHFKKAADALLKNHTYHITHVLREKNKLADKMANYGIDKKNKISVMLTKILTEYGLSF
jgi:ribonuclease HI